MRSFLIRSLTLATMAATACGAVGGGGMGAGMGGGGGGAGAGGGGGAGMGGGGGAGAGMGGGIGVGWGGNGGGAQGGIAGQRFEIVFVPDGGGAKKTSALQFDVHSLSCPFLARWNVDSLDYRAQQGHGHGDGFVADVHDDSGNSLKFNGALTGNAIAGTLTVHQAAGDHTTTFAFHGGVAGSAKAAAADAEAKDAVAAK